ncbi:hypothetical protein [Legionella sp.]|uniref:hypothetical protein n=1 Tax=Legionella sp. TaxID=459 RepID=UPI003C9598DB
MNDKVIPTYYSIMQLCDRWHFDLRQMRDFFSKKAIPLYACITGKKGGAFNQQVKVRETKINTATGEDLKRFGSLTNEELEKQGFIINSLEPNLYQVSKGTMCFLIDNNDSFKKVRIPALGVDAFDVLHDDFIELCDEHSIDPNKSLENLFENEELFTRIVKSKKDGHVRFLEPACIVKLEDIYIHNQDVYNAEQNKTKNKSIRHDIITEALLKIIFPSLKTNELASNKLGMICWEKLPDALLAIGCTEVKVDLKGELDMREFMAKHQKLAVPANNYKAFRKRIWGVLDYYLSNEKMNN